MRIELYTEDGCNEKGCCFECAAVEELLTNVIKDIKSNVEWEFKHEKCSEDICCIEVPCLALDQEIVLSGANWREKEIREAIKKKLR